MKRLLTAALATLTILSLVAVTGYAPSSRVPRPFTSRYNAEAYMKHLRYLAGDELGGRLPGTTGSVAATEYIAQQFKLAGLKPGGVDGTYFQPFTIRKLKTLHDDQAAFAITGLDRDWKIRRGLDPNAIFKNRETLRDHSHSLVYGIAADKYDYNRLR